jgi:type I restriction enzyme S subunit
MKFETKTLREISGGGSYGLGASASKVPIGPKFLRTTDIVRGTIDWDDVPFCEADTSTIHKYRLSANDIVISRTGANAGLNCLVAKPPTDSIFAGYLVRFQIDEKIADAHYVSYVLRSSVWDEYVANTRTGSAQPQLNAVLMGVFSFSLPPLDTQRAISQTLVALDEKIDSNQRLAQTLEEIAQAIFKSWFIDFEPVKAKMAGERPVGLDDATSALFPDSMGDSALGPIPTGWTDGTMAELFGLQGGYSFKSSSWTEDGVPVVKIGSVKPGLVDLNQVSYVDEELAEKTSSAYRLPRGSLVIGLTGYVGEVGLIKQHCKIPLLNQRVAKFLPVNGTWKIPFIYCLSRRPQFKQRVIDAANGSAQQNVSNSQILSLQVIVPRLELIESFNDQFESLFDQILVLAEQSAELTQLRDSLLPRLISGELQIPEEMLVAS